MIRRDIIKFKKQMSCFFGSHGTTDGWWKNEETQKEREYISTKWKRNLKS